MYIPSMSYLVDICTCLTATTAGLQCPTLFPYLSSTAHSANFQSFQFFTKICCSCFVRRPIFIINGIFYQNKMLAKSVEIFRNLWILSEFWEFFLLIGLSPGETKQAMITLQEMAVFNRSYGSKGDLIVTSNRNNQIIHLWFIKLLIANFPFSFSFDVSYCYS